MHLLRDLMILTVILALATLVFAQSRPPATPSERTPVTSEKSMTSDRAKAAQGSVTASTGIPQPAYVAEPFDATIEKLPGQYLGHSCDGIAQALKKAKPQKDEFETTDSYNARLELLKATPLVGGVRLGDTLAFIPTGRVMLLQKYDADAQSLQATFLATHDKIFSKPDIRIVQAAVVNVRDTKARTYQASNAYGKTVTVSATTYVVCGLIFNNRGGKYGRGTMEIKSSFQVEAIEARSLKENLGVLFEVILAPPYLSDYGSHAKPTINAPIEITHFGDSLVVDLRRVWFFNKSTGRVYARVDG